MRTTYNFIKTTRKLKDLHTYPRLKVMFTYQYKKLEPKASLCYFLGYGIKHKDYTCCDPMSNTLRISLHIAF